MLEILEHRRQVGRASAKKKLIADGGLLGNVKIMANCAGTRLLIVNVLIADARYLEWGNLNSL